MAVYWGRQAKAMSETLGGFVPPNDRGRLAAALLSKSVIDFVHISRISSFRHFAEMSLHGSRAHWLCSAKMAGLGTGGVVLPSRRAGAGGCGWSVLRTH